MQKLLQDTKKFLLAAASLLVVALVLSSIYEENKAEREAEFRSMTTAEKTKERIDGITKYRQGHTQDGREALQLTVQKDLIGFRSPYSELLHQAGEDIRHAYELHPGIDTLDIQYNVAVTNPYGEESYSPGVYVEIDKAQVNRIRWQNFDATRLPRIAVVRVLMDEIKTHKNGTSTR